MTVDHAPGTNPIRDTDGNAVTGFAGEEAAETWASVASARADEGESGGVSGGAVAGGERGVDPGLDD